MQVNVNSELGDLKTQVKELDISVKVICAKGKEKSDT